MIAIDTELTIYEGDFVALVTNISTIKDGEEVPGIKDVLNICIDEGIIYIAEASVISIKKI